jgi:hypothetical protein
MSGKFCPLHSNLYRSSEDLIQYSNNGTRGFSNPTKTSTGLLSIDVLPKYILLKDGVICICYIPNERKVLAIT